MNRGAATCPGDFLTFRQVRAAGGASLLAPGVLAREVLELAMVWGLEEDGRG